MTQEVLHGHEHYKMVDFVGLPMTSELYNDLHTRAKRARVSLFALLHMSHRDAQELDQAEADRNTLLNHRKHHAMTRRVTSGLIRAVFGNALFGVTANDPKWIDADETECHARDYLEKHLSDVQRYLDGRSDLSEKPIPVLRRILKRHGITLDRQQVMRDAVPD